MNKYKVTACYYVEKEVEAENEVEAEAKAKPFGTHIFHFADDICVEEIDFDDGEMEDD